MLMWALTWVQGWKLLAQWSWKINFAESTSSDLQPTEEGLVRRSQQIFSTSCSSVDHGREPCPVSSEAASQEGISGTVAVLFVCMTAVKTGFFVLAY
ncbi:hypothetical protein EJ110_NYTH21187 [Nymphaea thermarum]|nr:hypothetical protein EJ110_NYTH21187 [Nymphaea thermarum]